MRPFIVHLNIEPKVLLFQDCKLEVVGSTFIVVQNQTVATKNKTVKAVIPITSVGWVEMLEKEGTKNASA